MHTADPIDRIRQEQIQEGRRSTLSVPEGRSIPAHRTTHVGSAKPRFVPKGHDAILKALQDSKAEVTIVTAAGGETYRGVIFGRDKFTITLMEMSGLRRCFYKHDISQFYSQADLTKKPDAQVA